MLSRPSSAVSWTGIAVALPNTITYEASERLRLSSMLHNGAWPTHRHTWLGGNSDFEKCHAAQACTGPSASTSDVGNSEPTADSEESRPKTPAISSRRGKVSFSRLTAAPSVSPVMYSITTNEKLGIVDRVDRDDIGMIEGRG